MNDGVWLCYTDRYKGNMGSFRMHRVPYFLQVFLKMSKNTSLVNSYGREELLRNAYLQWKS